MDKKKKWFNIIIILYQIKYIYYFYQDILGYDASSLGTSLTDGADDGYDFFIL